MLSAAHHEVTLMKAYKGSCHCGQIRFEIVTDLIRATSCNCSICTKKGVIHHRVTAERFSLLSGQDALMLYQFDTKVAKHWFCKHCGIHPFSNPRAAPDMYSINIRCLDDYENLKDTIDVKLFDGRNWDEAIKSFDFQG